MKGRLFTLVDAGDELQVFAWGMEISTAYEREAIIYSRDPITNQTFFGLHTTAESALKRYGRRRQLRLIWEDDWR